jgi:glycosyltransferase involved in cell wall biosynthesis
MSELFIEWTGEILSSVGYGAHARKIIKALMDSGIKVKLIPAESYVPDSQKITDPFWVMKIAESASMPAAPIHINCCIPPVAQFSPTAKNILYFMWETSKLPRGWLPIIKQANQVWTGSDYSTEVARSINPTVLTIRPPVITPEVTSLELEGLSSEQILFTYIGLWIPRKNMEDLMTAFICAFDGVKNVTLLIKTWGADNSTGFKQTVLDRVRSHCNSHVGIDRAPVIIINELLPEQQINNILGRTDVYVSASRGEGFDLPLTTAMSMGKLVVANDFAAHHDYLTDTNSLIYKHSLRPVLTAMIPGYDAYQNWAQPDISSMIEQLREAYNLAVKRQPTDKGRIAKDTILEMCSIERTVETIKDALSKL